MLFRHAGPQLDRRAIEHLDMVAPVAVQRAVGEAETLRHQRRLRASSANPVTLLLHGT